MSYNPQPSDKACPKNKVKMTQDEALKILLHEFIHYVRRESHAATIRIHNSDWALITSIMSSIRKDQEQVLYDSEELAVNTMEKGISKLINSVIDKKEAVLYLVVII